MNSSASSLAIPSTDLKRGPSLKDKLRAISRGRPKSKENEQPLDLDNTSDVVAPSRSQTSRGRSPPARRPQTVNSEDSAISSDSDDSPTEEHVSAALYTDTSVEPVKDHHGTPSSGFFNSVFSAASNLGTALVAGSNKSPLTRSSAMMQQTYQPSSTMNLRDNAGMDRTTARSKEPHDLSLKDMGISGQVLVEEPQREGEPALSRAAPTSSDDADVFDDKQSLPVRSGSVTTQVRRGRRNSVATSMLGAADSHAQKITGFAVASNKRNREFHATFRSVPDADYLLDGNQPLKTLLTHYRLWLCPSERDTCAWAHVCI